MKLRNKKTGEIIDLEQWRFEYYKGSGCIAITNDKNQDEEFYYEAFADMKDDWEGYAPKEPLIKDEKIRKAVRAWASLYDGSAIRAHIGDDYVALFKDEVNGYSSSVEIDLSPEVFNELIDTHYCTIAELCGEEEE